MMQIQRLLFHLKLIADTRKPRLLVDDQTGTVGKTSTLTDIEFEPCLLHHLTVSHVITIIQTSSIYKKFDRWVTKYCIDSRRI